MLSEDQNYRETVRGVRAFMGWTHIPDLEYSPTSRADNPWIGYYSQSVGKVSILLPPEDWLCKKLENMNLVLIEGYPSKSSEPGGLHMDQFLRPPKSQSRWYGIHPAEPKDPTRPGKYVNSWPNDAAKINIAFSRIAKPNIANSQPSARPISQDTIRKWEKAAKESSYICNQSAGFNRCITKIQDSIQEQLRVLQAELGKGKSSAKAESALDELHYLTSFNQNVSFAMGKSLQHLSDFTFTQMANFTLVRRDSYLEQLKQGVKPDTFSSLRNCLLNGYALFLDAIIRKAEDEIAQHESAKRTSQPGLGHGVCHWAQKGQVRYQPYSTGWKGQDTSKPSGNSGKDMPAWKSFGGRGRPRGRGRGGPSNHGSRGCKDINQYKWQLLCKRPGSDNPALECCVNRNFKLKCKLLCCQSCTFCNKQCKAAAKERLKSSLKKQVRNKVCELCFFSRSLCFCSNCSQCLQCCSCSTSRQMPPALLADLGSPGGKSESGVNP